MYLVALLVSVGVTAMAAATVAGLVNFVSLAGRVGCGWLTDHLGGETSYTIAMLCSIVDGAGSPAGGTSTTRNGLVSA